MSKVDINSSAIALGHPPRLRARLMTTLLDELERTGGRLGHEVTPSRRHRHGETIVERL